MKRTILIISALALLSSCSKEPIKYTSKTNAQQCNFNKYSGKYKTVGYKIKDWMFTDTMYLNLKNEDSMRMVFPGQTRVNGMTIDFYSPNFCNVQYFNFRSELTGNLLLHSVYIKNDTLTDYVITGTDTVGIKFYTKY